MSQKTTPTEIPEINSSETTPSVPDTKDTITEQNFPKKDIKNTLAIKRKRKKLRKLLTWLIVLIVLATAGIFVWNKYFKKSAKETETGRTTYTVERRDITVSLPGTGAVEPVNSYTVSGLVKGEILEAPFSEGDHIEKGALLYRIDSSSIESSVERAELNVERAQISYDDLIQSKKDLTVTSDYSGVVQDLLVDVGDEVKDGAQIAKILDQDTMLVDLSFFSADAKRISVGQSAKITVGANMEQLDGVVKEISPVDTVGENGSLIRTVTLSVQNPGGITEKSSATAQIGDIACYKGGEFKYNVNETITAKTGGEVQKLNFKEGQSIRKGAVIAQLSSDSLDTQIKNSSLSLEDAKSSLQSTKDQADDYYITSPISGTVIAKNYEAGETISASTSSTEMAVIYDMSSLTFKMNIDELDIGNLKLDQAVTITSDALKGERYTGKVSKISIQGATTNGTTTYPVTVTIDEVGNLLPGMNINASIVTKQVKNVLAIPVNAVTRGNRVKVLVKEGTDTKSSDEKTTSKKSNSTETAKSTESKTNTAATTAQSQSTAGANGTTGAVSTAGSAPTGAASGGSAVTGGSTNGYTGTANAGAEHGENSNATVVGTATAGGYSGTAGAGTGETHRGMRANNGTDAGVSSTPMASTEGGTASQNTATANIGTANQGTAVSGGTSERTQGGAAPVWGQNAVGTAQNKTNTSAASGTQTQNGGTKGNFTAQNGSSEIQEFSDGTKYKEVFVTLGVDDDDYIEVTSGLNEGDVVIIESVVVPTSNNNPFAFGAAGGGNMGARNAGYGGGGYSGGGYNGGNSRSSGTYSGTRSYGSGTTVTTQSSSRSFSSQGGSGGGGSNARSGG